MSNEFIVWALFTGVVAVFLFVVIASRMHCNKWCETEAGWEVLTSTPHCWCIDPRTEELAQAPDWSLW